MKVPGAIKLDKKVLPVLHSLCCHCEHWSHCKASCLRRTLLPQSMHGCSSGFAPVFVNYKKGCTRLAATSDKVYHFLAHGRWFSPGTPASSTTKTGRHDIAEILLKVVLKTKNQSNQSNNLYIFYIHVQLSSWFLTRLKYLQINRTLFSNLFFQLLLLGK
jgi:hypothetical protein